MYRIFVKLGDGQFLFIASREGLQEATQLLEQLNTMWPGEYAIRDSEGNPVAGQMPGTNTETFFAKLRIGTDA